MRYPSSKGKRVRFSGGARTVIDGPFAEPLCPLDKNQSRHTRYRGPQPIFFVGDGSIRPSDADCERQKLSDLNNCFAPGFIIQGLNILPCEDHSAESENRKDVGTDQQEEQGFGHIRLGDRLVLVLLSKEWRHTSLKPCLGLAHLQADLRRKIKFSQMLLEGLWRDSPCCHPANRRKSFRIKRGRRDSNQQ
jgi:hypothetical protein